MRIIDFHTHRDDRWFNQPMPSEEEFLKALDRFDIEAACIFTLQGFYGDCSKHNDALAARAARHPDRLIPFATVDPKLGDESAAELERCLANPLFRGVKFHPWVQAFAPSMVRPTMIALLESAARYDVPVLFHDGTPPYSTTFQIAACARWVPQAKVVLGHAGLSDYIVAAGRLVRDIPNLYACVCGPRAGWLPYLLQTAGAEKLIFGSDFGFTDSTILAEFLDNVLNADVDRETLNFMLDKNASRLLHLDERPLSATATTSRTASSDSSLLR
jgi:predicted TIM-barrel fold metal-dependent hydrolase